MHKAPSFRENHWHNDCRC